MTSTALWLFDEGSGNTAADAIGSLDLDLTAALADEVTWTTDGAGNGIHYTETNATGVTKTVDSTAIDWNTATKFALRVYLNASAAGDGSDRIISLLANGNGAMSFTVGSSGDLTILGESQVGGSYDDGGFKTWNTPGLEDTAAVLEIVFDSSEASAVNRLRCYVDGSDLGAPDSESWTIGSGAGIRNNSPRTLEIGGTYSQPVFIGSLSIEMGTIPSTSEISSAATALASDHDTDPEGGTAYTLACAGATYSVSATAAGLEAGRKVAAAAASYSATASAAGLLSGKSVPTAAASYAFAPAAAALLADRRLPADAASYAIAEQAASLERGALVVADAASYSVAEQDVALKAGRKVAADAAAYTVSEQAAATLLGRLLASDAAAWSVVGQDVTLSYAGAAALAADGAAYAVSATSAGLLSGRVLPATGASYTVVAQAAATLVGRLLGAEVASYLVSEQPAGLKSGRLVAAAAAALSVIGQDITLVRGRGLTLDAAGFAIAEQDVQLLVDRVLAASGASYAWTAQDVSLVYATAFVYVASRLNVDVYLPDRNVDIYLPDRNVDVEL